MFFTLSNANPNWKYTVLRFTVSNAAFHAGLKFYVKRNLGYPKNHWANTKLSVYSFKRTDLARFKYDNIKSNFERL